MDLNQIKQSIGEFEEVAIRATAAISLVIVIIEILTSKLSHLFAKLTGKSITGSEHTPRRSCQKHQRTEGNAPREEGL